MATPVITKTQEASTFEVDYGGDKVQLSIVDGQIATVTSIPAIGGGLTITVDDNVKLMVQGITDYQAYIANNP
jgi:hypothetical protein